VASASPESDRLIHTSAARARVVLGLGHELGKLRGGEEDFVDLCERQPNRIHQCG